MKRILAVAALIAVFVMMFAACGGGNENSGNNEKGAVKVDGNRDAEATLKMLIAFKNLIAIVAQE